MSALERRARLFVLLVFVAGVASAHLLVGCGDNAEDPSTGTGGAGAGQGGTAESGAGGTAGSAGSASDAGAGGNAGEGGSVANGGTAGSAGSAGAAPSGGASGAGGQPGDGGTGGGGDIDLDECRDCIAESAELGPVQAKYCDVSTECIAVQNCVIEAGCFLPIPAACYCGADIDNCENADFVPRGACVDEIRAGAGEPADNATVVERFFDFTFPTGVGMQIVDEASRSCTGACFP